jgi:Ca2+-binding RTX toxin-like protein
MAAFFEPLETRQLMSFTLVNGLLNVVGTALPDVITVAQANGKLNLTENGKLSSFNATSVKKLIIDALGGNDQIRADMSVTKPLSLRGNEGNDTLAGGARGDSFNGGAGTDLADYSNRTDALNISMDDQVNDGAANEKDNVKSDVENVYTGSGSDTVRGSAQPNVIETGYGDDTVYAGAGNDTVRGGSGNDSLYGEDGADTVYGMSELPFTAVRNTRFTKKLNPFGELGEFGLGNGSLGGLQIRPILGPDNDFISGGDKFDTLYGNAGNDTISGGDWRDSIFGNDGDDSISGGNGDDIIDAGEGNDTVWGNSSPLSSLILGGIGRLGTTRLAAAATPRSIFGGLGNLGSIILNPGPIFTQPVSDVDVIFGRGGNDQLHGNGDGDSISGDDGNDKLWGDAGNDVLRGNRGNDSLYGGAGDDNLGGDDGDDILVAIGGGTRDSLFGSTGSDQYWQDDAATETNDADLGEILFGNIHKVASFANGVSKELNGQNFADPNPFTNRGTASMADDFTPPTANFRDNPLFSTNGVRETDVAQGQAGDCWFMAPLAGAAKQSRFRITQRLVDLGDGTYAAEFRSGTDPVFIRVDADLPVLSAGSTTPFYAGLGDQNCIWAPIFEKALCSFRGGGTYQGIWGQPIRNGFNALGFRDAGDVFVSGNGGATLGAIRDALNQGKIVTLTTPKSNPPAGTPAVKDHAYVVDHVNTTRTFLPFIGWIDLVTSVTCRNPWGYDGGGSADANVNDGLVTFSADQIQGYFTEAIASWAL